jgi:hypothetical protein
MVARWIAAAMLLVTLAITGIFVWAVFRPPPDSAAGSPGAGAPVSAIKRFDSGGKPRIARAEVVPGPSGAVAITVSITDAERRPVTTSARPTAVLSMISMAMGTEPVNLVPDGPGVWRGSGTLSMAGRWSLRVNVEGGSLHVPFETASR